MYETLINILIFCGIILLILYNWMKQRVNKLYSQWEDLYIDISTLIQPENELK